MIIHEAEGQTWTLNLAVCVPVYLADEAGEPLPGVRLDVRREAYFARPGLAAHWANPSTVLHHFGAGKRSLLASDWAELFAAAPPAGGAWDIWRPLGAEDEA